MVFQVNLDLFHHQLVDCFPHGSVRFCDSGQIVKSFPQRSMGFCLGLHWLKWWGASRPLEVCVWQICCDINALSFLLGVVPYLICTFCSCLWEKVVFLFSKTVEHSHNKVFHSSTWLMHSLWWLNAVHTNESLGSASHFKGMLSIFSELKKYGHASLQPTSAAEHTAC